MAATGVSLSVMKSAYISLIIGPRLMVSNPMSCSSRVMCMWKVVFLCISSVRYSFILPVKMPRHRILNESEGIQSLRKKMSPQKAVEEDGVMFLSGPNIG